MDFKTSQTRINLMRAFAGESMARNRYTFAKNKACELGYNAIADMFEFTACQEKEHAEVFYEFLKREMGENVEISASYPVDSDVDIISILKAATSNEYDENETIYPEFARIAKEEGFNDIAAAFNMIAKVEKTHGDRFAKYAQLIETDRLFKSDTEEQWVCLNCGHIHSGKSALQICPVCKAEIGYAVRVNTPIGG